MIKVNVQKGKNKTVAIDPADLVDAALHEIVSIKAKKEISKESIISFDGKKVVYSDGEDIEVNIPEQDLLTQSITQWVQKHLKSKAAMVITVVGIAK